MKKIIREAADSHLAWTEQFRASIKARTISEEVATCAYDDLCGFGKWLYNLDEPVKVSPAYRRVKDMHYRFHAEAAEIVRLMKAGRFNEATAHLAGDYAVSSANLLKALGDWQQDERD